MGRVHLIKGSSQAQGALSRCGEAQAEEPEGRKGGKSKKIAAQGAPGLEVSGTSGCGWGQGRGRWLWHLWEDLETQGNPPPPAAA